MSKYDERPALNDNGALKKEITGLLTNFAVTIMFLISTLFFVALSYRMLGA